MDALARAERARSEAVAGGARAGRPFQVLTVTSNKGGVGKTTLAHNLAVYLRALDEELPILVIGLDDQPMIDRMFALDGLPAKPTIADALRSGILQPAIRFGQYGVHYVPSSPEISELKGEIRSAEYLQQVLARAGWQGLVIVDTKSDLEILTRSAIAAADLTAVVVKDRASLFEAQRVFDLLRSWERAWERARVVLSLLDLRIRYADEGSPDVRSLLVSEVRRCGYPLLDNFVSRSPKVESLYTNPSGRALSILHGAPGTPVHRQMHGIAAELRAILGALPARSTAGIGIREDPPASGVALMKRWLIGGQATPGGSRYY
jgi:cellulose biosynthesis protein BcsQ